MLPTAVLGPGSEAGPSITVVGWSCDTPKDFGTDVLAGRYTSPLAAASACRIAISSFDGRPRFLGKVSAEDRKTVPKSPFAVGLG
jgi:hypothetical protein